MFNAATSSVRPPSTSPRGAPSQGTAEPNTPPCATSPALTPGPAKPLTPRPSGCHLPHLGDQHDSQKLLDPPTPTAKSHRGGLCSWPSVPCPASRGRLSSFGAKASLCPDGRMDGGLECGKEFPLPPAPPRGPSSGFTCPSLGPRPSRERSRLQREWGRSAHKLKNTDLVPRGQRLRLPKLTACGDPPQCGQRNRDPVPVLCLWDFPSPQTQEGSLEPLVFLGLPPF